MADTKTTGETARSPVDGTELVRLATAGANWKVTTSDFFGATNTVLKSGTPSPSYSGALTNLHTDANGKISYTPMATAFASLPATPQNGMVVIVTDATVTNPGAVVSGGGGTQNVLAYYNGPTAQWVTFSTPPAFQGRLILQADVSYYVSPTGNDTTGDGTSANPWATIQHANKFLQDHIDFGSHRVDLILKDPGTYVGSSLMGGYVGGGILSIHGATNVPASYVVTDDATGAFGVFEFLNDTATYVRIDNMTLKQVTNFNDSIWVNGRTFVTVAGNFGDGLGQHVIQDFSSDVTNANGWICSGGGKLYVLGTIDIIPPPTQTVFTYYGSFGEDDNSTGASFTSSAATLTCSNSIRFGQYTFCDTQSLLLPSYPFSFTAGSCLAGKKFNVDTGGIVNTFGAIQSLPGTTQGLLSNGGQIV